VRQVFDPAAFTKVLNDAGVPAVVTIHRFHTSMACTGGGDPEAGDLLRKIISAAPGSPGHMMTIRPSLIPHGGTLTFDYAFYPGSTYPAVGTGFANVHGFSPCRWVPAPSRASHP
jgi:hypothetical protein